ncbi:MaoC/PaaZ C-terminal domain-containing protein [Gordonia shandongensis]|uniref:MaoC/PaaZ C-terminal domain-containing protein n=1 Tax=Gordonia shandongensis TaxID=376351 RepID=UPI000421572F|nr:MaoC/PaaZ C-terminal domain-containing protein [Gordonia shandongensis]
MQVDAALIDRPPVIGSREWSEKDTLLYAVAVGAGQADPTEELAFTTENTDGVPHRVLPTFASLAYGGAAAKLLAGVDRTRLLHGAQGFTVASEIPVEGSVRTETRVSAVYDKGSAAVVEIESVASGPDGRRCGAVRSSMFLRGYGGFGGDPGPVDDWERPTRPPDVEVTLPVRRDQGLVYRLTGDRNPLHSDPALARRAGYDRPILHGMCTFGFTGRAVLHGIAGSDPARLTEMSGRFSAPLLPGQDITVAMWVDGDQVRFRTTDQDGTTVIDRGRARVTEPTDVTEPTESTGEQP